MILVSVILICVRLSKRATSKQLKHIILKRHIIYFIIFIPFIVLAELHFSRAKRQGIVDRSTYSIFKGCLSMSGLGLGMVRICDPYIWQYIKKDFGVLLGQCQFSKTKQKPKMKMKPMREESLESFLRSDVNTEFIYIILLGIKHFFSLEDGVTIKNNKMSI